MNRIYHPYTEWEDWQAGMWRSVSGSEKIELLRKAIEFTGDAELYGSFMRKVLVEWPIACEHNLTDESQNRKAWIGHAATCMAIDCPEDITRSAWYQLTQQQRDDANQQAQNAIDEWVSLHEKKNSAVHQKVGVAGLSKRNTGSSRPEAGAIEQMPLIPKDMHGNFEE